MHIERKRECTRSACYQIRLKRNRNKKLIYIARNWNLKKKKKKKKRWNKRWKKKKVGKTRKGCKNMKKNWKKEKKEKRRKIGNGTDDESTDSEKLIYFFFKLRLRQKDFVILLFNVQSVLILSVDFQLLQPSKSTSFFMDNFVCVRVETCEINSSI